MGKIFGIADLPISTIMSPFEPTVNFQNPFEDELEYAIKNQSRKFQNQTDVYIPKSPKAKSNPIISMRNGFGKLMKHFSKKI